MRTAKGHGEEFCVSTIFSTGSYHSSVNPLLLKIKRKKNRNRYTCMSCIFQKHSDILMSECREIFLQKLYLCIYKGRRA